MEKPSEKRWTLDEAEQFQIDRDDKRRREQGKQDLKRLIDTVFDYCKDLQGLHSPDPDADMLDYEPDIVMLPYRVYRNIEKVGMFEAFEKVQEGYRVIFPHGACIVMGCPILEPSDEKFRVLFCYEGPVRDGT